jgi:hypothetical protein
MSQADNYYNNVRAANRQIWDGLHALLTLQAQHNALDYGNTLPDGEGNNAGLTKVEVGAVTFDTANALKTVLNSGHATNMAKLL